MASYIYLSSDTQLLTNELVDRKKDNDQTIIYFSHDSTRFFFFEDLFDSKNQDMFSCSKHFSEGKYQVASVNKYLLDEPSKNGKQQNKKAIRELFDYLVNHFEQTRATYVEILFCSESDENAPLLQEKLVSYEWLTVDDLHYAERKFMRIDTQMTEFIFRRRIA